MSDCPSVILIEYKERPVKIGHYNHWKVCKCFGILNCEKWFIYQAERITETKGVTIPWDFAIQTYRRIKGNRSDIVLKNY